MIASASTVCKLLVYKVRQTDLSYTYKETPTTKVPTSSVLFYFTGNAPLRNSLQRRQTSLRAPFNSAAAAARRFPSTDRPNPASTCLRSGRPNTRRLWPPGIAVGCSLAAESHLAALVRVPPPVITDGQRTC